MKILNLFSKSSKSQRKKKNINIDATKQTPEIVLNESDLRILIRGSSYPENAAALYTPVIEWLDEIDQDFNGEFVCEFDFNFLSSSSHKMVYDILYKLQLLYRKNKKIQIVWYYEEADEDIMDKGDEFTRLLDMPVKLIAKKDKE